VSPRSHAGDYSAGLMRPPPIRRRQKTKRAPPRHKQPAEPDPSLLALSARIRTLRGAIKITQEQLAVRAGISLAFASMIERAARGASIETLAKVARALGVPLAELFRERSDMTYDDPYFERLIAFAAAAQLSHNDIERLIEVASVVFQVPRDRIPPLPAPPAVAEVSRCTVRGCERPSLARSLCASHYHAQRREQG
jgi:transcriptional regulator with XRE-family HTH domain